MWKKSLKQTIQGNVWKFLIGSLGAIITLLTIGKNYLGMTLIHSALLGISALGILFLLRFLYYLLRNIVIYIHNTYVDSIWGEAIIDLKDAYAEIHALRKKEHFDDKEFMATMIVFCDTLKKIFDRKTKANCCVSIKVPIADSDNLETIELRNLCSDISHKDRDTETYQKTRHTIIGNTPYRVIVNKILKQNPKHFAYLNNNIEQTPDYDNSSRDCYTDGILPYKSELVYPIIPIKRSDNKNYKMCGFICIDCNKTDKFDENRYDIPMVEGIADGIYDVIMRRNNQ